MFAVAVVSLIASLALVVRVLRMQALFKGLTLRYSWRWSVIAAIAVFVSTAMSGQLFQRSPAMSSLLQLLSVVLMLTPAVSTLGARNPGVVAWQMFVVVPLVIVLLWPGLSDLISSRGGEPLRLSIPAFSGLCIVLLMSMSTCVGTSLTVASLFFLSAVVVGVLPAMGWVDFNSPLPYATPVLLLWGVRSASQLLRLRFLAIDAARTRSDLVDASWGLFQDLYGLVWARRIQERVNQFAVREKWSVLLTPDGFRDVDGNPPNDHDLDKPRDALRWVLTRFADEQWIVEKLFRLG
jgi:hypothetical protein